MGIGLPVTPFKGERRFCDLSDGFGSLAGSVFPLLKIFGIVGHQTADSRQKPSSEIVQSVF
jgi:hypothetical protein